jgi:hypothetical protein
MGAELQNILRDEGADETEGGEVCLGGTVGGRMLGDDGMSGKDKPMT